MADFVMPSLGAGMEAGTLVAWRMAPGDVVTRGDIIAEVETEKGLIEVECFASGIVEAHLVQPGTKVPVGTPLARIAETGSTPHSPPTEAAPAAPRGPERATTPTRKAHSTPAARHLAREHDVDPERLRGTGPHGTVTKNDVARAVAPPEAASRPAPRVLVASPYARRRAHERGVDWRTVPPAADGVVHVDAVERAVAVGADAGREADPMRRAIAAAMSRANRDIPHYYVGQTIDLGPAVAFVESQNAKRAPRDRLLLGALLLHATVRALAEHPRFNGFHDGRGFVVAEGVNLGVAVSLKKRGLVAPAVLGADQMSLDRLMTAFRDLVTRAKKGQLRSSEMSEATITVTSLGERGVELVVPIINPPQVAMVGFGAIVERPWVVDGAVVPRPTVTCTLAADHRVTDGHEGGRFVAAIERYLLDPGEGD